MNLGEIYLWETDRAQGHERRKKFHVYICEHDNGDGSAFLYINSVDWYKDYKLTQANYNFLIYDFFVGCSAVVQYTAAELAAVKPQLVGQLTAPDMKGLRDLIIAAETMEQQDANCICKALAASL